MAMVGGHDGVFDARRGKLTDRSRQVIYDRVHHLPGLEREASLAGVVDLLRAHHDDLGAIDLLGELRRLQAQSSSRETSAKFGTRAAANFFRAARSGRKASSMRTPSVPPCSTTLKLDDAPG